MSLVWWFRALLLICASQVRIPVSVFKYQNCPTFLPCTYVIIAVYLHNYLLYTYVFLCGVPLCFFVMYLHVYLWHTYLSFCGIPMDLFAVYLRFYLQYTYVFICSILTYLFAVYLPIILFKNNSVMCGNNN